MLFPVRVVYEVERTVYVDALVSQMARDRARDPDLWADADPPDHDRLETVRVVRKQTVAASADRG